LIELTVIIAALAPGRRQSPDAAVFEPPVMDAVALNQGSNILGGRRMGKLELVRKRTRDAGVPGHPKLQLRIGRASSTQSAAPGTMR